MPPLSPTALIPDSVQPESSSENAYGVASRKSQYYFHCACPAIVFTLLSMQTIIIFYVYEPILPDIIPSHYVNGLPTRFTPKDDLLEIFLVVSTVIPSVMLILNNVLFRAIARKNPYLPKRFIYSDAVLNYWNNQPRVVRWNVIVWFHVYASYIPIVIQTCLIVGFWAFYQSLVSGSNSLYLLFILVGSELFVILALLYRHHQYFSSFA